MHQIPQSSIAWHAIRPHNVYEVSSIPSLGQAISKLQTEMLGGEKFSRDAVTVRVGQQDTVYIKLIGLPGYLYYDGTSKKIGEYVKLLSMEYIMDVNTIVLVIVPAIQEIKTVNIYNVLSEDEREAFHARNTYCFYDNFLSVFQI